MKRFFVPLFIFIVVFVVYYAVGTQYTFRPKWAIDYFNPMAKTLLQGHFYIENPTQTYDLIYFKEKWYIPWGILPAVFFIPPQIILGRFVPAFYLTVFFASLNVTVFYLLLLRLKREFFSALSGVFISLTVIFFAFGTTEFYVGTLGSVWHVSQMVAAFFASLGIFMIFKKKRFLKDYFYSSLFFSIALLCRPSTVFLIVLPFLLYIFDFLQKKRINFQALGKGIGVMLLPFMICLSWFFFYNYVRFDNIFQTGYSYIQESPYLAEIRKTNGISSIKNIPQNIWYLLFEIPNITISNNRIHFNFNLNGNSILFLSPPFLAIFFAMPIKKKGNKFVFDYYIAALWLTCIFGLLPVLMHYSSGWMQFGYRYSLEITPILLLLTIFGLRGKLNVLYILGIIFSVYIYILGIHKLM